MFARCWERDRGHTSGFPLLLYAFLLLYRLVVSVSGSGDSVVLWTSMSLIDCRGGLKLGSVGPSVMLAGS